MPVSRKDGCFLKLLTVVGARPQFIKAAAVSRVLRKTHTEILLHTGQHYDRNMSEIFFDELHIPHPDYNLGVGSASHGRQTGEMLIKIEEILLKEKPDAVLVYGDTNSTLAGALAASKLLIPVAHVEAGLRSYNKAMPEEQNRVLTDHISRFLFCPTETAVGNLKKEGVTENVYNTGDVMTDALFYYRNIAERRFESVAACALKPLFGSPSIPENGYILCTIHRAENTAGGKKLEKILAAFERFPLPAVFPAHPRIQEQLAQLHQTHRYKNIVFVEPVSYLTMIYLTSHASGVVTDSGGLQKEAYLLKVPCVTVRDQTEWVETLVGGWNALAKAETEDILQKTAAASPDETQRRDYYGSGDAAEKISRLLSDTGFTGMDQKG